MGTIRWLYETFFWKRPENTSSNSPAGRWEEKQHEKRIAAFGFKLFSLPVLIGGVALGVDHGLNSLSEWAKDAPSISDRNIVTSSEQTAQKASPPTLTSTTPAPIKAPEIALDHTRTFQEVTQHCATVNNHFIRNYKPQQPIDLSAIRLDLILCIDREGEKPESCGLAFSFLTNAQYDINAANIPGATLRHIARCAHPSEQAQQQQVLDALF